MTDAPDWLDAQARARVEGALASLAQRGETLGAWLSLLSRVGGPGSPEYVDWLAVDRYEGREYDVGMHRHWLDRYGIRGHYVPLTVAPEHLAQVLHALPRAGFVGLNVTIPHKQAVLALADVVTDRAALIGAANTLIFRPDGRIHADTTDGYGFTANLFQQQPEWNPAAGPAVSAAPRRLAGRRQTAAPRAGRSRPGTSSSGRRAGWSAPPGRVAAARPAAAAGRAGRR